MVLMPIEDVKQDAVNDAYKAYEESNNQRMDFIAAITIFHYKIAADEVGPCIMCRKSPAITTKLLQFTGLITDTAAAATAVAGLCDHYHR